MTIRKEMCALWKIATTDGCTSSPDWWYHECCNDHDRAYRTGVDRRGKPTTRAKADKALFLCMTRRRKGMPISGILIPSFYWLAVRLFGWRFWKH